MASVLRTGALMAPSQTGPVTVTGLGFAPAVVLFIATSVCHDQERNGDAVLSLGVMAAGVGRASSLYSDNVSAPLDVLHMASSSRVVSVIDDQGAVQVAAEPAGLSEDGFSIVFTHVDPPEGAFHETRIGWIAFGGPSLTGAALLERTTPLAAGDETLDFGVAPDVVLFLVPSTTIKADGSVYADPWAVAPAQQDAHASIGVTDMLSQYYTGVCSEDASNPAVATRRTRTNRVVGIVSDAGVHAEAQFIRRNASGAVLLQWHTVAAVGLPYLALGLKVPRAKLTTFATPTTDIAQSVTGVGFQPTGLLLLSGGQTAAAVATGATNAEGVLALGAVADPGASRVATTLYDSAGAGQTESHFVSTGALSFPTGGAAMKVDVDSFDADGFTTTAWEHTDGTAHHVAALAFGEAPAADVIPRDLLDWPDKRVVVIAEITPSVEPTGWVSEGPTYPDTWSVPLARFVQASVIRGGVYRRVDGVREDDEDLTRCSSIAEVDAHAGGWWWDEANDTLYVRTASGDAPASVDALQVFTTYFVATQGIVLDGVYYHPWLSLALPRIASSVQDLVFGVQVAASGSVSLMNGSSVWDTLIPTHAWYRKRIVMAAAGTYRGISLTRSQCIPCDTLLIESLSASAEVMELGVVQQTTVLQMQTPPTPIFEGEYPNLPDQVRGTRKPLIYGRCTYRPPLVDQVGRVYLLADAAYQTLTAVERVDLVRQSETGTGERVTLTPADYDVDLAACTVTLQEALELTYPIAEWSIEVAVVGKPDGLGSYLRTGAAIALDLLRTVGGVAADAIDHESFALASLEFPFEMALCLVEERSLSAVLSSSDAGEPSIERSCFGRLRPTETGRWTFSIWSPAYDPTALHLRATEIETLRTHRALEPAASVVRVQWGRDLASDRWQVAECAMPRTAHLKETTRPFEPRTYLNDADGADLMARRYAALFARRPTTLELTELGTRLGAHRAGDRVRFSYPRAATLSGAYDQACFEIITHDKAADLRSSSVLSDMAGFGDTVGVIADVGAPAWASASEDERKALAFIADGNGFVDPGDPTTRNAKVIW